MKLEQHLQKLDLELDSEWELVQRAYDSRRFMLLRDLTSTNKVAKERAAEKLAELENVYRDLQKNWLGWQSKAENSPIKGLNGHAASSGKINFAHPHHRERDDEDPSANYWRGIFVFAAATSIAILVAVGGIYFHNYQKEKAEFDSRLGLASESSNSTSLGESWTEFLNSTIFNTSNTPAS